MKVVRLAVAAACVFVQMPSLFAEDGIHCSEVGGAYNELLVANRKRSLDTVTLMKSLKPKQLEQQKVALVKKECSIGGEMIGLVSVWKTQIDACATSGENLGTLPADVKKTLDELKENMTGLCG